MEYGWTYEQLLLDHAQQLRVLFGRLKTKKERISVSKAKCGMSKIDYLDYFWQLQSSCSREDHKTVD